MKDIVRHTVYCLDPLDGNPDKEVMQIVNQLSFIFIFDHAILFFFFMLIIC